MSLAWLQAKAYIVGGIFLTVVGFLARLKWVTVQRDSAVKKGVELTAVVEQEKLSKTLTAEVRKEFAAKEREARKDVKEGKLPSNLENPNDF